MRGPRYQAKRLISTSLRRYTLLEQSLPAFFFFSYMPLYYNNARGGLEWTWLY